jgi:hypothetical protein
MLLDSNRVTRYNILSLSLSRYNMNFMGESIRSTSFDEDRTLDSLALPKFSFESDDRPLVSTERLFRQWQDEETQYDSGYSTIERTLNKEQDLIVGMML